MKKTVLLACLLGFCSITAQADPNDDIWIKIASLSTQTGNNTARIQNLQSEIASIWSALKNSDAKIQKLSSELETMQANKYKIGEMYRGGLVFYIDESGQHGLIASKIDISIQGVEWRNGTAGNRNTNARGDGVGAGETNTHIIIAQQTQDDQKGNFAALIASNFQVLADGITPCKTPISPDQVCYGGWYLPSAFELQLMYTNLHQQNLSAFVPEFYWSSTEANVSKAWLIDFASGELTASSKSNTLGHVRAINHF